MRRLIVALLSSVPLVACVTVEDAPTDRRSSQPPVSGEVNPAVQAPVIDDPDGFDLGQLEPKTLADGECGIFLFTRNPSPRFVFFANDSRGFAEMVINGERAVLQRMSTGGTPFAQSFSEQVFQDGMRQVEVALTLTPGEAMEGGYEISGGSMRLTKVDGWSMVIPVSGAAACQTRSIQDIG